MHSNRCRMTTWGLGLVLAGWLLAGLLGCCGHNTQRDYGNSVTHNIASQLVNPTAGQTVYVSRGETPEAAVGAYEKYNKSFKEKAEKPVYQTTSMTGGGQ
jgi:hypothetical protein